MINQIVDIFPGHYMIPEILKRYPIAIDGGACVGVATVSILEEVLKTKIYAFEPDIKNFNELQKFSRKSWLRNPLVAIQAALVGKNHFGQVLYYPNDVKEWGYLEGYGNSRSGGIGKEYLVDTIPFNSIIKKYNIPTPIGYLKLDIEGPEKDIILEFDKNTKNIIKQLSVEISEEEKKNQELKTHLISIGYTVPNVELEEELFAYV